MNASQQFLNKIGIRFPVIQAPMVGVATPELVAEVSNAGGLGSLGIGASAVAQARQLIEQTRALTNKPFNVNVFCHEPAKHDAQSEAAWLEHLSPLFAKFNITPPKQLNEIYQTFLADDDAFNLLLELRPAVVSFHFGLPSVERIRALQDVGITLFATATNLREAMLIEQAGIDAVIAQGIEAGGHRGCFNPDITDEKLSTAVLTRLLTQRTQLPVISSGGIADGQGIQAMMTLGAVAAQLGSAFILCPESAASEGYRQMLRSERAAQTCLTSGLSGRPARGIVNEFISHCEMAGSVTPAAYPLAYDGAKQIISAAAKQGNNEYAAYWTGQAAPLFREMAAAELVSTLVSELAK